MLKVSVVLNEHISEPWDVTYYIGSHNVTCHPTQVKAPQPSRPVLDLPTPEGWKAELGCQDSILANGYPSLVLTQLDVE